MGRRQAKGVPALYGAVTLGLVVAIAALALVVQQPPPPPVAEFAPNPQQIEESRQEQAAPQAQGECFGPGCDPLQQSSEVAAGGAGQDGVLGPGAQQRAGEQPGEQAGPGVPTPGPSAGPTGPNGPPVPLRRCYGSPPRQSPDPHAPLCVAEVFRGDNGGATGAQGVTATAIRVALPVRATVRSHDIARWHGLVQYFNANYEFWGRFIEPVYVTVYNYDPSAETAAEAMAQQQPFAVVGGGILTSPRQVYAIARRGIVTVGGGGGFELHESEMAAAEDFAWQVRTDWERISQAAGAIVCDGLAGRRARHAGDGMAGKQRKFGLIIHRDDDFNIVTDARPLQTALQRCGVRATVREVLDEYEDTTGQNKQAMQAFKEQGVTSVLDLPGPSVVDAIDDADAVGYHPEWFSIGRVPHCWPCVETKVFGIYDGTRALPEGAARQHPHIDSNSTTAATDYALYDEMLLLAAGIQGAGKDLTAESFAQALRTTVWPNPGAGSAPYYQQSLGLDGDHTLYDDHMIWWWNPDAPSDNGLGAPCYVGAGSDERFLPGEVPSGLDTLLFNKGRPCD